MSGYDCSSTVLSVMHVVCVCVCLVLAVAIAKVPLPVAVLHLLLPHPNLFPLPSGASTV